MTNNKSAVPLANERILEEARLKITIAREHVADLQNFGLTEDWLNDLQAAIDSAENFPTFSRQRQELKALTAAKDRALEECVRWGRQLRFRLEFITRNQDFTEIQFPNKSWAESQSNESKMIALLPSLLDIARQYASVLAKAGQTEADLQAGDIAFQSLKKANEAQERYNFTRTSITQQRRQLFRRLYDSVNQINQVGQLAYLPESPEALQFRSNWTTGRPSASDSDDEALDKGDEDIADSDNSPAR